MPRWPRKRGGPLRATHLAQNARTSVKNDSPMDNKTGIFDKQIALPDETLIDQEQHLMGFEARFARVSRQLRLLMHLSELQKWSQEQHKGKTLICRYVAEQYPLVLFHGDVGTGKSATAECMANRLVTQDRHAADSTLFKLSTRVRGSGRVGEMGSLINDAFERVVAAAGKNKRSILIIDEGDSLAAKRSQEYSHHEDKVAVNTLIQNIDDLKPLRGRVLVILCTNRLGIVDPAIQRRAAVTEEFARPTDDERLRLFEHDLTDLHLTKADFGALVKETGPHGKSGVSWTYSDLRTRLYPAAVASAYPDSPVTAKLLLETVRALRPSPAIDDL